MFGVRTKRRAFGWWAHVFFIIAMSIARNSTADEPILIITDPPADGLVTARVDLTAAALWCQKTPMVPNGLRAMSQDGQAVPLQFIPDADFDGNARATGCCRAALPDSQTTAATGIWSR